MASLVYVLVWQADDEFVFVEVFGTKDALAIYVTEHKLITYDIHSRLVQT